MTAGHAIPAFKKIGELLTDYLADTTGLEVTAPDFSALRSAAYADDGGDMCYVKDCGRAIALLQLADRLSYRTYNAGRAGNER